ncbi:MAG: rRNA methyltransferase [Verrucomicrobia bacterium]|nr:rRNA methyltransferase [Verrucomicrobiota bacterium]
MASSLFLRDSALSRATLHRVNLILFESEDATMELPRSDPRAVHLLEVLRRKVGDVFDAGVINGPRGKGTLQAIVADSLSLAFTWGATPPLLDPITLVIGLPRPQTARDILRDATALGVSALHFVVTEKGERNYAQSTLWSSGEWRRHLIDGAQQAFDTRVPEVTHGRDLAEVVATLPENSSRLALDNYEAAESLGVCHLLNDKPVVLALGAERGWGAGDRRVLREAGFQLVHLGTRVLRTETATTAAVVLVRSKLGLI